MRIAVIGAGAMGSLYGGYLSRKHEVTLVGTRETHMEKIRRDGLLIAEADGTQTHVFPDARVNTSDMPPCDLVLVQVKAMATDSALAGHRELIGPDTYLMTLQNGMGHEEILKRYTDEDHVVLGTTKHNSSVTGLGEIRHSGTGMTYIGCITGDFRRLRFIADAMNECGLMCECLSNVRRLIWDKLFTNASSSVLSGILQVPQGFVLTNPDAWSLCQLLIRETAAVADADGMFFDPDEKIKEIRHLLTDNPTGLTSIYADLRDGRKTEVDTISGAVIAVGKRHGIETPVQNTMVALIHAMEARASQNP